MHLLQLSLLLLAAASPCTGGSAAAAGGSTRRVYTYFTRGAGAEKELEAISLWNASWTAAGWTPTVLSLADAKKHPRFKDFLAAFFDLLTNNRVEYEARRARSAPRMRLQNALYANLSLSSPEMPNNAGPDARPGHELRWEHV